MSTLHVDLELVKKYSVPGPRYTSYPPATQFTDKIDLTNLAEKVRGMNADARDLSLYFHLPFCESLCWFCGCTTVITTNHKVSGKYLDYLGKEMELMRSLIDSNRKVTQLHFGGGTPTFLAPDELRRLGKMIHTQFKFSADLEAGVEIDPRHVTHDHVLALREIGFNRASMGVQDNNPVVQKAVHRI